MQILLQRHWFLLVLCLFLAAGFGWGRHLNMVPGYLPAGPVVAVVLLLMSLSLDARAMGRAIARPWGVTLAVGVNFGLTPLVAWGLSRVVATVSAEFAAGLLVAASVPTTLASAAVWTRRAGGNDSIPLLATMITNASCFLVTPLWIIATTGANARLDARQMMVQLAWTCVLPMALGQVLRLVRGIAVWADRRRTLLGVLAQCGILSFVLSGAIKAGGQLAGLPAGGPGVVAWLAMILSVAGLHVAMLVAASLLGRLLRLSREDQIGAAFSGSQKTLAIGLVLAQQHFGPLAMLPMIAYHATQLLIDTVVAERWRRPPGLQSAMVPAAGAERAAPPESTATTG